MALSCQREAFDFPPTDGDEPLTYLNCAYLGPLPRASRDAAKAACERQTQPFVHLAGKPGEQLSSFHADVEACRTAMAALVGAAAEEIALVPSTSYAMAVACKNLCPPGALQSGDNLLVIEQQFQSNYYCWEEAAAEAGATLLVVPRPADFDWTAAVLAALSAAGGPAGGPVRVAALPSCHWTDGSTLDLVRIGVKCREMGTALVVDGTQSVGAAPFDVKEVQPDFMAVSSYKWCLCPYGLAFLYASKKWQESGAPLEQHNWERRGDGFYNYEYTPGSRRFDGGQPSNFITLPAAAVSLQQLGRWTPAAIAEYTRPLIARACERGEALGLSAPPPAHRSAHLVGVRLPKGRLTPEGLQRLAAALLERGVHVSIRGTAVRLAPHVWNVMADIDRAFDVLAELLAPGSELDEDGAVPAARL